MRVSSVARAWVAEALLAAVACDGRLTRPSGAGANGSPRTAKMRGVSWVGGPRPIGTEHLAPLTDSHVDWIVQTPYRRYGKPVLFTEIGYRSDPDGAAKPRVWPRDPRAQAAEGDLRLQADCYEAFFHTFWDEEWFAGAFFWKWYPALPTDERATNVDYSPQGKPAGQVLARWYGGSAAREIDHP